MKIVTMAVAILLNTLAPTLALAATYLEGAEANANTLVRDAYVQVTYYDSNAEQKLVKGWIDTIGETSFTVREGGFRGKKTIAYDKVVSVIMSDESTAPVKQMNEVNRFIREMKAREIEQAKKEKEAKEKQMQKFYAGEPRVRVYAPSIRKGWMVGKLIKKTQDTLVVRGELTLYGRRFYQVPLSSISNFEVSTGQHRNTFKGMVIGCGISLAISTAYHSAWAGQFAPLLPSSNRGRIIFIGPIFICALVGAMTKSDKWGEVSPQSLNLSVAPTSTKGLRAALTFNF